MEAKERKLELADIAGYLPYRLRIQHRDLDFVRCVDSVDFTTGDILMYDDSGANYVCITDCLPILRPMTDLVKPMTHPDINGGEEFVPIAYISFDILGNYIPNKWEIKYGSYTIDGEIVRQTIGVEYSDNLGGGQYAVCFSKGNTSVHIRNANGDMVDTRCTMTVIEFLQKMHFDYLGLIGQGLAIDINTIK